jgi:hypothetical protein
VIAAFYARKSTGKEGRGDADAVRGRPGDPGAGRAAVSALGGRSAGEGPVMEGAVMRYDRGYPVDEDQQCVATTSAGRRCKNKPLMQGDVRLSNGTMGTVTEQKCALHGGQAAAANAAIAESLRRSAEDRRRVWREPRSRRGKS